MVSTHGGDEAALSAAEKQNAVIELVREGVSFREIGERLRMSKSQAHRYFRAGVDRIPAENVAAYREQQLADCALARQLVYDILGAHHVTISNGHVVSEITGQDEDGKPVYGDPYEDCAPVLAALDRLVKIGEREARITGSDAEKKVELSGSLKYEVVGIADEDLS